MRTITSLILQHADTIVDLLDKLKSGLNKGWQIHTKVMKDIEVDGNSYPYVWLMVKYDEGKDSM